MTRLRAVDRASPTESSRRVATTRHSPFVPRIAISYTYGVLMLRLLRRDVSGELSWVQHAVESSAPVSGTWRRCRAASRCRHHMRTATDRSWPSPSGLALSVRGGLSWLRRCDAE